MNGEETEAKKIVASIKEQTSSDAGPSKTERNDSSVSEDPSKRQKLALPLSEDGEESDDTQYSDTNSNKDSEMRELKGKAVEAAEEFDAPRRRSTRSKKGGKKAS